MQSSFFRLGLGMVFAVVLVYLLMTVNFQSWLDPFIILTALPGAMAGILWMLFVTGTTLSVPSLMGAIMCIGVATANSILMVTFANDERDGSVPAREPRCSSAGYARIRPVLMTATAMILGMLPMALGLGEGGEQNAPLGRAVIGGLMFATVTTLFVVPIIYSYLRKQAAGRSPAAGWWNGSGKPSDALHRNTIRSTQIAAETAEESLRRENRELKRQLEELKSPGSPEAPRKSVASFGDHHLGHLSGESRSLIVVAFFAGYIPLQKRQAVIAGEAHEEQQALPRVEVIKVGRSTRQSELELPGNIQPITEAPILARADGYIERRMVDIGDRVQAGQTWRRSTRPN